MPQGDPDDVGFDAGKAEVKTVGLRPEDISLVAGENMGRIHGRIELVENLAADHVLYVTLPSGARIVSRVSSRDWMKHALEGRGETMDLHFDRKDLHLFDRQDRRIETADSARAILRAGYGRAARVPPEGTGFVTIVARAGAATGS